MTNTSNTSGETRQSSYTTTSNYDGTNNATTVKYIVNNGMDREQYEEDLKRRQDEHLKSIKRQQDEYSLENLKFEPNQRPWQPCLHDQCQSCHGTGLKLTGEMCIHYLSCNCPKCTVIC